MTKTKKRSSERQPATAKPTRKCGLKGKPIDSNREPAGLFGDERCRHCNCRFPRYEEECPRCLGLRSEPPDIAVPPEKRLKVNAGLEAALKRQRDALLEKQLNALLVPGVH